jgi:hypothetical protein
MSMPHNIEKSAFRRGEYVGYGSGHVWRIRKEGDLWLATTAGLMVRIRSKTFASMSRQLETVET